MKAASIFLLIFVGLLVHCHALTGQDLYTICTPESGTSNSAGDNGYCEGYIVGVADALIFNQNLVDWNTHKPLYPQRLCLPDGVHCPQIVLVAKKYLSDHPEQLQNSAARLIDNALVKAFPCTTEFEKKSTEKGPGAGT